MTVPADLKVLEFGFQVIKPSFEVELMGLKSANNSRDRMSFSGVVYTADVEDVQAVEKLIAVQYDGSKTNITWQHDVAQRTYKFTIGNIVRKNAAAKMRISWNGQSIGSDAERRPRDRSAGYRRF